MRLYGARVDVTESLGGMGEAVDAAREMARDPDTFLPDQFSNPANPEIHRRTTGPEIERALDGRVDVLVAGVGTGGTITGVGEYLRERNPQLRVVAVEPAGSAVLSGGQPGPHRIQGIGAGFVPPVLNRELLDEVIAVSDDDAIHTAWTLRPAGGPVGRHLLRGSPVGIASDRGPPGVQGQEDRRDHAGLRRALRLTGLLRPLTPPTVGPRNPHAGSSRAASQSTPIPALERIFDERPFGARCGLASDADRCAGNYLKFGRYAVDMLGLDTFARVAKELRRDVLAARDRDPAARGVAQAEILATWPGIHALLAYRTAHALHEAGVPLLPRLISMVTRALTGIEIHPCGAYRARPVHRPRGGRRDR